MLALGVITGWRPDLGASELGARSDDHEVLLSDDLKQAIERSLSFMAHSQNADGSWTSAEYGKNVGEISLMLMAFMATGNVPGEGPYGSQVARGLEWILRQQQPTGLIQFTGQLRQAPVMYGHALATLMLSEVWGQSRHRSGPGDVGVVLRQAVDLIVQVQGPRGGWGYQSRPQDGDTSVCVMQVLALKSAQAAGIFVPQATIDRALHLLKTERYDQQTPGYGYNSNRYTPNHMGASAAGTCIMLIAGEPDVRYTLRPLEFLIKQRRDVNRRINYAYYFAYYTSISAYVAGDAHFRPWMKTLEPWLLKTQQGDGSWGGPGHQTAFAILSAAMPYRYLPVYQR